MKNILITGAGGFIGRNLFNFLKLRKLNVFGTINKHKNKKQKITGRVYGKNIIKCDLSNGKDVKKLLSKINPKIIYHFAAIADHNFSEKNKKLCRKNNSQVTKNIIKYAGKDIRLIFLSSDKVYANNPKKSPEKTNLFPKGYLAKEKIKCEKIIIKKIKNYFILRLPIVHSDGKDYKNSTIDNFLYLLKKNKKVSVFKNIKRSFLKINEFNLFLEKLLISENFGIYNVGSKVFTYSERLESLCKYNKINYKKNIIKIKGFIKPKVQNFNTNKVKKKFNFKFT